MSDETKILKTGQLVHYKLQMKVLKVFAQSDDIYYIVGVLKKDTPLRHMEQPLWGVLNVDGSCEAIPAEVMKRAATIVATMDFSQLE